MCGGTRVPRRGTETNSQFVTRASRRVRVSSCASAKKKTKGISGIRANISFVASSLSSRKYPNENFSPAARFELYRVTAVMCAERTMETTRAGTDDGLVARRETAPSGRYIYLGNKIRRLPSGRTLAGIAIAFPSLQTHAGHFNTLVSNVTLSLRLRRKISSK